MGQGAQLGWPLTVQTWIRYNLKNNNFLVGRKRKTNWTNSELLQARFCGQVDHFPGMLNCNFIQVCWLLYALLNLSLALTVSLQEGRNACLPACLRSAYGMCCTVGASKQMQSEPRWSFANLTVAANSRGGLSFIVAASYFEIIDIPCKSFQLWPQGWGKRSRFHSSTLFIQLFISSRVSTKKTFAQNLSLGQNALLPFWYPHLPNVMPGRSFQVFWLGFFL